VCVCVCVSYKSCPYSGHVLCSLFRVACKQRSVDVTTLRNGCKKNHQKPKICCTYQFDEGSEREEKERLHDLDNNVPRAAYSNYFLSLPFLKLSIMRSARSVLSIKITAHSVLSIMRAANSVLSIMRAAHSILSIMRAAQSNQTVVSDYGSNIRQ
jgi:hypothetical protein